MPYTWGTTGLCYRSDLVKTAPTSWNDLLAAVRRRSKGKTTMLATDRWLLAAGLLAQGLFGQRDRSGQDRAEVKDLLIDAKKTLLAYDDTTFYSKLVSGEACWCRPGTAGATTASPRTRTIKYVIPKEGSDLWVDTMVVMKASENKDAAHAVHQLHPRRQNHGLGGAEHHVQGAEQGRRWRASTSRLPGEISRTWRSRRPIS